MTFQRAQRILMLLLGAGAALRLGLMSMSPGVDFDMESLALAANAVVDTPLGTYGINEGAQPRWPYPGAYLPVLGVLQLLAEAGRWSFESLVRLPVIAADLALAWLSFRWLRWSGASPRRCLCAGGVLALGPSLTLASAVHGQIDAVAWLPAAAALLVWERAISMSDGAPAGRRERAALAAGALLGLAVAVKTTPAMLLLALLPAMRGWRERGALLLPVAVLPVALTLPFAIESLAGLGDALSYRGSVGRAGLTTLIDPELAVFSLSDGPFPAGGGWGLFFNLTSFIVGVPLILAAIWLAQRGARPLDASIVLVLVFLAVAPSVLPQYMVWAAPLLVLSGRVGWAVVFQLSVLPFQVASYLLGADPAFGEGPHLLDEDIVRSVYVPYIGLLLVASIAGAIGMARRMRGGPVASDVSSAVTADSGASAQRLQKADEPVASPSSAWPAHSRGSVCAGKQRTPG